jgi:hypothetical protein
LRESLIVELQLPEDFLVLKARRVQHLGREELLKPFQLPLVCDDPRKFLGLLRFLGHVVPEPTIYLGKIDVFIVERRFGSTMHGLGTLILYVVKGFLELSYIHVRHFEVFFQQLGRRA